MAHYEKLVRDRIPEILDKKGVPYEQRMADYTEYRSELIKKLVEEAVEFSEAGAVGELADVLEVIKTLRELPEYDQVEVLQKQKAEERGGFSKRIILKGEK
jgi:predicted house-cleaning noncanonical NTP pyrophosphatase (MazG superfamily)